MSERSKYYSQYGEDQIIEGYFNQLGLNKGTFFEMGAGDGVVLSMTKHKSYLGYDVSNTTLTSLRSKYGNDQSRNFIHYDGGELSQEQLKESRSDLALSMEMLFHLVEENVWEQYLENLFALGTKYVIILSSNCLEDQNLKAVFESIHSKKQPASIRVRNGICSDPSAHVLHRAFLSRVLEKESDDWVLFDFIPNKHPELCFSDFYFFKRLSREA